MLHRIAKELFAIATANITAYGAVRVWYSPVEDSHLPQELYQCALRNCKVEAMKDAEILPVFFTAEACTLLKTLPNRYWFWFIIKEALACAGCDNSDSLIGVDSLKAAIRNTRLQVNSGLNVLKPSGEVTVDEWLLRMAQGLVLVKMENGKPASVPNPIFAAPRE